MSEIYQNMRRTVNEISVKLDGESKLRRVGSLVGGTLYVQRVRAKHLMRKYGNAYGVNEYVINNLLGLQNIHISDDEGKYLIPKEDFIKGGIVEQPFGFDKQIFVPIQIIEKYKL